MQPELFERPGFTLTPEPGRTGPKLWVRRLVIWREPKEAIRDVPLRPGLNIIWSPDSIEENSPIGHGGGKTTFCRLLRFCLGEDTFAPPVLRQRIADVFPKGHVGAEIMLDGHLWIVVRSLGIRRRDFVEEGGQLEDAFQESSKPTSIEPLIEALTKSILGSSVALMPRTIGPSAAWRALLAWMTRDQECRFGHALDWRSSDSDSRSPVVNRSAEDLLLVVRAAIGALNADEMATLQEEEELRNTISELKSSQSHLAWEIGRSRNSLEATLGQAGSDGTTETPLAVEYWKTAADEEMAKALDIPNRIRVGDVQAARSSRDIAKEDLDRLKAESSGLKSEIEAKEHSATFVRSELPAAYAKQISEENPVCPVCKVLIDKALAEGCGITKETCDLHALRSEIERKKALLSDVEREITSLRGNLKRLQPSIADAESAYADASRQLEAVERAYDTSSKSVHTAQQLKADVARFSDRVAERESTRLQVQTVEDSLEEIKKKLAGFRQASSERIRQLSDKFDAVLRELVPGVCGTARIDGNGLKLNVEWGGDRSTAALDSLKVVVLDLAVLIMSMEHTLFLPDMLVHDSPREADLSAKVYSRLFTFASRLESFTTEPYFQYIITTTTAPPPDFQQKPWLALSIKGAPGEERLFGVDL